MKCRDCDFHRSSYLWNRCDLAEMEYYQEYSSEPCPIIDDEYKFKEDHEGLGFIRGNSAIEFMGGNHG